MTIQDHFPYDSTNTDLAEVYHPVGDDSFFINSPRIFAEDRIMSKSKIYWLARNDGNHPHLEVFMSEYRSLPSSDQLLEFNFN